MKLTLKAEIFNIRNSLPKSEVTFKSNEIRKRLFILYEFVQAKNVLFYVSTGNEVDTQELIKYQLTLKDKIILVPYTFKKDFRLHISELKNFNELTPKDFGILEPKEQYKRDFNPDKLDIVIVPGIVFDKRGYRIGYGYGYYDRFLKKLNPKTIKIALAFDFQLINRILQEEHDVPMDIIITDKEVLRIK